MFLSFRIFEQLVLALKTEFALNSLYWIYIFYHRGFLSNLRLPWKTELPWSFSLYGNVFIIQDFWATCACPENRVCPEIFQDRGLRLCPKGVRLCLQAKSPSQMGAAATSNSLLGGRVARQASSIIWNVIRAVIGWKPLIKRIRLHFVNVRPGTPLLRNCSVK